MNREKPAAAAVEAAKKGRVLKPVKKFKGLKKSIFSKDYVREDADGNPIPEKKEEKKEDKKAASRGPVFDDEKLTDAEKKIITAAGSKTSEATSYAALQGPGIPKPKPQESEQGDPGTRTESELKRIRAKVKRLSSVAREDVETRPNAHPKTSGPKPEGVSETTKNVFDRKDQTEELGDAVMKTRKK